VAARAAVQLVEPAAVALAAALVAAVPVAAAAAASDHSETRMRQRNAQVPAKNWPGRGNFSLRLGPRKPGGKSPPGLHGLASGLATMRLAPITRRVLFSSVLFLGLAFGLTAPVALAQPAPASPVAHHSLSATSPDTPALIGALSSWFGNRTRMVQVALVFVGLGILILHGKNHR
jgi:hypothetical protein